MNNSESLVLIERLKVFWAAICWLGDNVEKRSLLDCLFHRKKTPLEPLMEALPSLHFPEDIVLDYYQIGNDTGSYPRLYVRRKNEARIPDYKGFPSIDGKTEPGMRPVEAVLPEKTPEGIWEFILLEELGDQFNLKWHMGTSLLRIIYDWQEFFETQNYAGQKECEDCRVNEGLLSSQDRQTLLSWNIMPEIEMQKNGAIAHYCVFSPFTGFYLVRRKITHTPKLNCSSSTKIIKKLPYNCGIIY